MDTPVFITAPDGANIYGYLESFGKANKLVIFAHGLASHCNAYHIRRGSEYLADKGFDCLRFDFYSDEHKARKLEDCTLEIHKADLEAIVNHCAKQYDDITVIGHSYGGTAALMAQHPSQVKRLILWDPSLPESCLWQQTLQDMTQQNGQWIEKGRFTLTYGDAMVQEGLSLNKEKTQSILSQVSKPCGFIIAGDGLYVESTPRIIQHMHSPAQYTVIDHADHNFNTGQSWHKLILETERLIHTL